MGTTLFCKYPSILKDAIQKHDTKKINLILKNLSVKANATHIRECIDLIKTLQKKNVSFKSSLRQGAIYALEELPIYFFPKLLNLYYSKEKSFSLKIEGETKQIPLTNESPLYSKIKNYSSLLLSTAISYNVLLAINTTVHYVYESWYYKNIMKKFQRALKHKSCESIDYLLKEQNINES